MLVKELRELLKDAPDDIPVLVMVENHLKPGMFAFAEACTCDTGVTTLGPDENGANEGTEAFLVLPHNSGVPEEDIENGKDIIPELN